MGPFNEYLAAEFGARGANDAHLRTKQAIRVEEIQRRIQHALREIARRPDDDHHTGLRGGFPGRRETGLSVAVSHAERGLSNA